MNDDDIPELDDFTSDIQKIKPEINKNEQNSNDFLPNKLNEQNFEKKLNEKSDIIEKKPKESFSGFKKGFFSQTESKKNQEKKIDELKIDQNLKNKNKLEIPEVQEAMKMQNFLTEQKDQWMTPDLLQKVSENPNVAKLFSNPEYLNAINLMQSNPKAAMEKYGKNPEFMQIFQEFCKIMGGHFMNISGKENKNLNQIDKETERIQKLLNEDKEVIEIMKDEQIQKIINYMKTNEKVDFYRLINSNPSVAKKIQVLIHKGVINIQNN